jgi:molecular chaperone DnaJ
LRRAQARGYDQFGHAGVDAAARDSAPGARLRGPEGFGGFADAFGDIFGEIFGQGRGARGNGVFRGADLRYNLELSLEEAARGTEVKIRIPTMEECGTCHGSGAKPGTQPKQCPACTVAAKCACRRGSSPSSRPARNATARARSFPTLFNVQRRGTHQEAQDAVGQDSGGRRSGRSHRLSGEGEGGMNGGPTGDLYVVVNLKPHQVFQREGATCIARCRSASVRQRSAASSRSHARRSRDHQDPPETQTGQVFRLRNKGIRRVRGSVTGDLYCHVVIETPVKLTSRQRELLREFEAINDEDPERTARARSLLRQGPGILRVLTTRGGSMAAVLTALRYLWVSPASLLGLAAALVALSLGATVRCVDGVIEVAGGRLRAVMSVLPPAFRFGAITLGHVIIGLDHATLARSRSHEHVHVAQYERWACCFSFSIRQSSLVQLLRGRHPYWDNAFERKAFGASARGAIGVRRGGALRADGLV